MLQIKNLTITHLRDLRSLTEDFSLCINPGDKAALIGEEGNGKSTLLKLIYDSQLVQNYVEYSGEIVFDGNKMGYLPQEPGEELKNKTVYEFCCSCEGFFEKTPKELADIGRQLGLDISFFYSEQIIGTLSGGDREENIKICTWLGSMKFTPEEMQHKIRRLSGGQKAKLLFLKMVLTPYDLLILDEPTRNISPLSNPVIRKILQEFPGAILSISHDRKYISDVCDTVYELDGTLHISSEW